MPARKKSNNRINGIDVKSMLEAFEAFEEEYGISREEIARLLAESIETVVKKKHVEGLPDLLVQVNIDIDSGDISIFNLKNVVEDVEDDAIEISLEDAKEIKSDAKIGDVMEFAVPLTDFGVPEVKKLKTVFVQKIKEAQKAAIYAIYKDKIDELITGTVDNIDPGKRFVSVNIGRTFVTLPRKEMIGDEIETIRPGQQLKVYLSGIGNSEQGIVVSRACPGFLKRLFEEEIRDVYDGTVIIKDIARVAGERSKVSVMSNDFNVDPVGACIGPGGSKIQKICAQLNHEKIDVIQYYDLKGLFIAECLQPAHVVGVKDNGDGSYIAVVKDGELKVAIGKKGVNARLAVKLAGGKIDIKEYSEAVEENIDFVPVEELKKQNDELVKEKKRLAMIEKSKEDEEKRKQTLASLTASADDIEDDEEYEDDESLENETSSEEETLDTPVEEAAPANESEKEDVKVEETPVEFKPVILQDHVSLSDLEKQIDEEKKQKAQAPVSKKKKKPEEEKDEKEEKKEERFTPRKDMYTEDELAELEAEEAEEDYDDDDEIDYDQFDQYYDDK